MKKPVKFLIALLFLNSACQKPATNDLSGLNAEISNTGGFTSQQIRIFTAVDLVGYVRENKSETDQMLAKHRIMVSGTIKYLDKTAANLEGGARGEVICRGTIFYQDEWKKLNRLYADFSGKRSLRPVATVSGVYQKNSPPEQSTDNRTKVFLEDCKIETATK